MNVKAKYICRLCLKAAKNEFQKVDEFVKQIFDVLLLKLDLDMTRDSIVCERCMEIAKKCLDFKSTCVGTEQFILSFSIDSENARHSINVIYGQGEHAETICGDLEVCRFCMIRMSRNNFVPLDALTNESNMSEMLSAYMPEMDSNMIENPIICITCKENLQGYIKFVLTCLDIEEKIKAYSKEEGTDNICQVKLDKLHLLYKDVLDCPQICAIKQEPNTFKNNEYKNNQVFVELINFKEVVIKEEINLEKSSKNPYKNIKEKLDMILLGYQKEIQANKEDPQKRVSETRTYKCLSCTYQSKHKTLLKKHMLVHKDASEITMYKCTSCTYETKRKHDLKTHMLVHRDVSEIKTYNCSLCAYVGKHNSNLRKHMLVHKDVSEVKMYKCSLCTYESKQNGSLKKHMLVHKDVSEIKMFKCTLCAYEAKRNGDLKNHMVVHKDATEIQMYSCTVCSYEAKRKGDLNNHMLVHKDISEITMYKCSSCSYETKQKSYLPIHMLVHKDVHRLKRYKCSLCAYEAKQKGHLKRHMLVHKDVA